MSLWTGFVGAIVALAIGGLASPFIFKMLLAMKSRQTISQHIQEHAHKQGTPTMGGIIVLVGLLAGLLSVWKPGFVAPLVLVLGFGLVGFLDDYLMPRWKAGSRGLSWMPKLGLEIGASILAALFMGWREPWQIGFFVFMVLFLSNAYNFSDGLDGLAGGLGMILSFGLAALIFLSGGRVLDTPGVVDFSGNSTFIGALVCVILGASFIPFLFLNAPPAKVFMGDVGALPIGAVLGWVFSVVMLSGGSVSGLEINWSASIGVLILLLIMFVEIVPVPLQIASVKLRKKRLFNFKTPVHHAFQEKGWPETRIVWMFHLVQIVLVVLALSVVVMPKGTL